MTWCCKEWAEETSFVKAFAGGGVGLYPQSMHPDAQIVPDKDGTWNVNGCCGGGCYVLTDVRFCPFCGANVFVEPPEDMAR